MTNIKIITVTANTAIDYVIHVKNLKYGDNQIADSSIEFAAGKGINVAKAIESLGGTVQAAGFVGKASYPLFSSLKSDKFRCSYTLVEGKTRTNITLSDSVNHTETHIRNHGFNVTEKDCNQLIQQLVGNSNHNSLIILSGSLPNGAMPDLYQHIITLCQKKSARIFLDSSGDSLRYGLKACPFLIKPNQQEFEDLIGKRLQTENDIIQAAQEIINNGVTQILLSRAEKGAILITKDTVITANIDCKQYGKLVSHVGCGDAMLAGFALAMSQEANLQDCIKMAVSCGAANLFSFEPGKLNQSLVKEMQKHINVLELTSFRNKY